jgi:endonuclease-8
MPEGDAIRAVAGLLEQRLVGRRLVHGRVVRGNPLCLDGATVTAVRARGKHLLVRLAASSGDLGVRVHLGLGGRWHRYRPGPRWCGPADARFGIVLATADDVLVCIEPARVDAGAWARVVSHSALLRLGPDVMADPCPAESASGRARASAGGRTVLEVLLDQQVACGIGNIAAHEALFVQGIHPARPAVGLDAAAWAGLFRAAARLLHGRVALGGRGAQVRPAVYGRGGAPCLRCGGAVVAVRRGLHGRPSAWCAHCQPPPPGPDVDVPASAE